MTGYPFKGSNKALLEQNLRLEEGLLRKRVETVRGRHGNRQMGDEARRPFTLLLKFLVRIDLAQSLAEVFLFSSTWDTKYTERKNI